MENKKVKSIFESKSKFPLHRWYTGQDMPQEAYITLDLERGEINAEYQGLNEVQNDPEVLIFPISHVSLSKDIEGIINDYLADFQSIYEGSEIEWDGSNYVVKLTKDAQERYESISWDIDVKMICIFLADQV